jgi:hypothetical protein
MLAEDEGCLVIGHESARQREAAGCVDPTGPALAVL